MSPAAFSSLSRLLIGSLIGAVIGLILLALGVAILWNAADQRLADAAPVAPVTEAPSPAVKRDPPTDAAASPVPYPAVAPGSSTPPVAVAPSPPAATSIWRSIFADDGEALAVPPPPPAATPGAARPAPRPATPRPSTPRPAPEAQRQDDSLFF